jgi:hypothetical protein
VRFAVFVALFASPGVAAAGPWTRELWSYYAKAGADYYSASGYTDPRTGEPSGNDYFGQQYGLYGELGVSPAWPVQVSALLPVTSGTASFKDEIRFGSGEGHATTTRFGDARFAAQTSLLREPFPLAFALELKVPLYRNGSVGAEHEAYRQYFPLPGDGQLDWTGWVLAGTSIPSASMWVEGGVGYRHRTETFIGFDPGPGVTLVDGITGRALVGVMTKRVLVMANAEAIQNLESSRYTRENLSVGPSVLVTLWRGLAVEGRFAWEAWAKNQSQGIGFGLGISMRDPV